MVKAASKATNKNKNDAKCIWSNMRGGFKLLPGRVRFDFITESSNNCHFPPFDGAQNREYWSSFPPRTKPVARSSKEFDYDVCVIGDSNVKNVWTEYVKLVPDVSNLRQVMSPQAITQASTRRLREEA